MERRPLSAPPDTVRFMTWNIHGTLGLNPRFDLDGVIDLIRRWSPDIVALQEVDSRRDPSAPRDCFALLQEALGKHGIAARSIATAEAITDRC